MLRLRRGLPIGLGLLALVGLQACVAPDDDDDTSPGDDDDLSAGSTLFQDVGEEAGISIATGGFGVGVADVNLDGWPDLFFPSLQSTRLFLNQGDGTFVDVAQAWGIVQAEGENSPFGCTFADYDNDGDPDLFVATAVGPDLLYEHGGVDSYERLSNSGMEGGGDAYSQSLSLADVDRDGDLDLYKTGGDDGSQEWGAPTGPASPDHIYRNDEGTFVELLDLVPHALLRGFAFIGGWSDLDQDGDPDLYTVNDFGNIVSNQLFRNDTVGDEWAFTPMGEECGCLLQAAGMGLGISDYDRDGWQDLYTSNTVTINDLGDSSGEVALAETLLRNLGDLSFVDVSLTMDAWAGSAKRRSSWGVEFLDIDNDMWPDLFVPFGRENEPDPDVILMNQQGQRFELIEDSGVGSLDWGNGAAVIDYDLDGCLDLAVAYENGPARLYRNHCETGNHWLQLELRGTASNRDAVGAVVRVTAGGITQREEVFAGSTSLSSSRWKTIHVGMAGQTTAETIEVRWPSGRVDLLQDVAVDRNYLFVEGQAELQLQH